MTTCAAVINTNRNRGNAKQASHHVGGDSFRRNDRPRNNEITRASPASILAAAAADPNVASDSFKTKGKRELSAREQRMVIKRSATIQDVLELAQVKASSPVRSPTLKRSRSSLMQASAELRTRLKNRSRGTIDPRTSKVMPYWDFVTTLAIIFTAFVCARARKAHLCPASHS